jgi:type I restriction enzyme, S subunit
MGLKSGYKQTEAGVIPEDWSVVLLDTVAMRGSGHTPDKKHPEYWDGDIKWVSLKDSDQLDDLYIFDTAAKITPAGIANSSAVLHPAGTVILSRDAGVGKSAIMMDEMAVSQHFMAWKCGPRLDNHFLYYWLQAKKPEFERIAIGNTIKTIGLPYFKKLLFPLPSFVEQRTIAGALRDIDTQISVLDQLIAKKSDIKHAAMQQLFTGKQRLPGFNGEWDVKHLREVGTFAKGKGIKKDEVVSHGIPCIRYGEIYTYHNDYIREFRSFITIQIAKHSQLISKGDLLFAGSGETAEEIGKCVAFLGDEEAYAGGDIVIFTPSGQNSMYLGYLMNHPSISGQKARMGQGDAVVHISAKNLGQLKLRLPSLPEQTAIATVLSDIDAEIVALEHRRDKTLSIKQGMMQELLTGKIRLI